MTAPLYRFDGLPKISQSRSRSWRKKIFEFQIGWCDARCIWLLFMCGPRNGFSWDGAQLATNFSSHSMRQRGRGDIISRILCFFLLFISTIFLRFCLRVHLMSAAKESLRTIRLHMPSPERYRHSVLFSIHIPHGRRVGDTWMSWLNSLVLHSAFYRQITAGCRCTCRYLGVWFNVGISFQTSTASTWTKAHEKLSLDTPISGHRNFAVGHDAILPIKHKHRIAQRMEEKERRMLPLTSHVFCGMSATSHHECIIMRHIGMWNIPYARNIQKRNEWREEEKKWEIDR